MRKADMVAVFKQFRDTSDETPVLFWSGLLFLIFPMAGEVVVWLSFQILGLSWAQERVWPGADQYGLLAVILVPLILSYVPVRRLDHPVLPWLWLYGIVASAITIGSGPILTRLGTLTDFQWGITAVSAISMIVLVWLARKVSSESFRHSLLFIGMAAAVHVPVSFIPPQFLAGPSFADTLPTYLILLIGGALLKGTAVWALVNTRYVVSSTRTVLPAVIAILLTGSALVPLAPSLWHHLHRVSWVLGILSVGVSSLLFNLLVVALAYAVRIREPRSPVTATSHPG
ncbi:MAG: hypothetical protein OXC95_15915 [Dehalococcoidia bacterium]|nr:hypothetical protein [Dehalococcoidia bacterium]